MAKTVNNAKNASQSEINSLAAIGKYYIQKKWTIVLRDPSGGRGGATSDIAIYNTIKDNYENDGTIIMTIDVYTPSNNSGKVIAENVRKKLSQQASGVCLDLRNIPEKSHISIMDTIKNILKSHHMEKRLVLAHNKGSNVKKI